MVSSLVLENFKAFGGRRAIPIKPLTLVFGPNSAGKSSLFQALLTLSLTAQQRDDETFLLKTRSEGIDIGSPESLIYNHDPERALELVIASSAGQYTIESGPGGDDDWYGRRGSTELERLAQNCGVESLKFGVGHRFRVGPYGRLVLDRLNIYLGDTSEPVFHLSPDSAQPQLGTTGRMGVPVRVTGLNRSHPIWTRLAAGSSTGAAKKSVEQILAEVDSDKNPKDLLYRALGVDVSPRAQETNYGDFYEIPYSELEAFRLRAPELDRLAIEAAESMAWGMKVIRYIGPLREPPRRYIPINEGASSLRVTGSLLPLQLYWDPNLLALVNKELDDLGIGYRLMVEELRTSAGVGSGMLNIGLRTRGGVTVGFPDVGFGISQLLPIIVQCATSRHDIVLIEQPELHLHPALQSKVADFFIRSALRLESETTTFVDMDTFEEKEFSSRVKNTIIVETHSEHLILRIMRRLRETAEGRIDHGMPPVTPDMISIIYVKPTPEGAIPIPMELSEDGELLTPWPGGFFEEGFRDRFA